MDWDRALQETIDGFYLGIKLTVTIGILVMVATCTLFVLFIIGAAAQLIAWMLIL